jgi:hypothetical protein
VGLGFAGRLAEDAREVDANHMQARGDVAQPAVGLQRLLVAHQRNDLDR